MLEGFRDVVRVAHHSCSLFRVRVQELDDADVADAQGEARRDRVVLAVHRTREDLVDVVRRRELVVLRDVLILAVAEQLRDVR